MRQPVQHDKNKPFSRWRRGGKKSLWLLAAHTSVLRSNLSGVLFASYFNKSAQWVYQTALMKGLLAGLPAADPLDPECVFTINRLVSTAGYIQSPPPPPLSCLTRPPSLKHKRPHLQERAPTTPPPPRLPQNLSSITPQVLHTYTAVQRGAGTHPLWTHCTFLHCAGMWAHICNTQIRFMRPISKNVPQKKKSYTCVLTCMFRQKCMCTYTYMYPVHIHIGINFMQRPTFLVT